MLNGKTEIQPVPRYFHQTNLIMIKMEQMVASWITLGPAKGDSVIQNKFEWEVFNYLCSN